MSAASALRMAAAQLAGVSETPRLDAELLLAHVLGTTREAMLLHMPDEAPDDYQALVGRRLAHEPVAYITGRRAFWTIELAVTPDVLIPRPASETLIEAAVAQFGANGPARVIDLGTGSGALLLAALAEWPGARGLGVDMSAPALAVAATNARMLGLAERAAFVRAGWERAGDEGFDLVLCNPPYIAEGEALPPDVVRFEPGSALYAGADGLADYRVLAAELRLQPGGLACFEIGATQADAVGGLFAARGFLIDVKRDLAGHDRCVLVRPR